MGAKQELNLTTLKILSFALMMSQFILMIVLFITNNHPGMADNLWKFHFQDHTQPILMAFCGVAFVNAFLSGGIKLILDKAQKPSQDLAAGYPGSSSSKLFYNWNAFTPAMATTTIVRLALAESIGILGFVLGHLNGSVMNMVPFLVVALFLQFLWSPFCRKGCA